jgi:antitoxin CcdA
MLVYYATLRQFMRIPMGVLMRASHGIKKSVNLSSSPETLKRRVGLNLISAAYSAALQEQFRAHQRAEWLAENKASIEAINQWVDENGSFSDSQRSF